MHHAPITEVAWSRRASKSLARLPRAVQDQILDRLTRAQAGEIALKAPPPGLRVGRTAVWRAGIFQLRCGDYRLAIVRPSVSSWEIVDVYHRGASPLSSSEF